MTITIETMTDNHGKALRDIDDEHLGVWDSWAAGSHALLFDRHVPGGRGTFNDLREAGWVEPLGLRYHLSAAGEEALVSWRERRTTRAQQNP